MYEFILNIALMFGITEQEINNSVLPDPIEIEEEVIGTPEEEFEKFLLELKKDLK